MEKIPYFDCCALIILAFLYIACYFRGMTKGRINRYFIALIAVSAITTVFDITSMIFDNIADPALIAAQSASHMGYLYLHNLTPPLYVIYVVANTDTFHKFRHDRPDLLFAAFPAVIYTAIFITNFFSGTIFYVDSEAVYHRGSGIIALYGLAVIFMAIAAVYIIRCRKVLGTMKFASMLTIFPLLLSAVAIQFIFPSIRVEMFAISLGLLFVATFVQRPEIYIDYETGLFKFSAYASDMRRSFYNDKPMDVILIDIVNFLRLQEILDYDEVNELLRLIAKRLTDAARARVRSDADIYYLDKGRFRIVLGSYARKESEELANAVNDVLKPLLPVGGMELSLVPYVCIAHCPDDISDFDTLNSFGIALSKAAYTGQVLYARPLLEQSRYNIISKLDSILEKAMKERSFEVYYQPIYSVNEGCFRSAEALVRLKDEEYGYISPELFVPAAEKNGIIAWLGKFVLEEVCRFIASDDFASIGLDYIEVNLSVVQCMQSGLADDIKDMTAKYNINPARINLEITESADSETQTIMKENMASLLEAGFTFSLDDFGTGYSNMQRMASLPLKIVKLDKTFVGFGSDPKLISVLRNTVRMLKAMDMEIVVEGVETEELADTIKELECEYIQGFFYSRPIPRDSFVEFIRIGNKHILT